MFRTVRPKFEITLSKKEINQGDELTIKVNVSRRVNSLYMRIIGPKGINVWANTLLARGSLDKYHFMIGSKYFETKGEYQIQISNNLKYSPIGIAFVYVNPKKSSLLPLLPFILAPVGIVPALIKPYTIKKDDTDKFTNQTPDDDFLYLYMTERDARVCPICKKDDGKFFKPNKPKPSLPQHINCRCYYEIVKRNTLTGKRLNYLQQFYKPRLTNKDMVNVVKTIRSISA